MDLISAGAISVACDGEATGEIGGKFKVRLVGSNGSSTESVPGGWVGNSELPITLYHSYVVDGAVDSVQNNGINSSHFSVVVALYRALTIYIKEVSKCLFECNKSSNYETL